MSFGYPNCCPVSYFCFGTCLVLSLIKLRLQGDLELLTPEDLTDAFSFLHFEVSTLALMLAIIPMQVHGPELLNERISLPCYASAYYELRSQPARPPPSLWKCRVLVPTTTGQPLPVICDNLQRLSFQEKREFEQYLKDYSVAKRRIGRYMPGVRQVRPGKIPVKEERNEGASSRKEY